jgi:hypothetical protein
MADQSVQSTTSRFHGPWRNSSWFAARSLRLAVVSQVGLPDVPGLQTRARRLGAQPRPIICATSKALDGAHRRAILHRHTDPLTRRSLSPTGATPAHQLRRSSTRTAEELRAFQHRPPMHAATTHRNFSMSIRSAPFWSYCAYNSERPSGDTEIPLPVAPVADKTGVLLPVVKLKNSIV